MNNDNNEELQGENPAPTGGYSRFAPDEYYIGPQGFIVFTEAYHLRRGYCCKSNCRHCPYDFKKNNEEAC